MFAQPHCSSSNFYLHSMYSERTYLKGGGLCSAFPHLQQPNQLALDTSSQCSPTFSSPLSLSCPLSQPASLLVQHLRVAPAVHIYRRSKSSRLKGISMPTGLSATPPRRERPLTFRFVLVTPRFPPSMKTQQYHHRSTGMRSTGTSLSEVVTSLRARSIPR